MKIYTCKDDLTGMMTCIYDAWAGRWGHSNVKLLREPILQPDLFSEYVHVDADEEKAVKVLRSIRQKISETAYQDVMYAALSGQEDALDTIYRFLVIGFAYGAKASSMLSYAPVMRLLELKRNVGNEAHLMHEFTRFTSVGGKVYVSHIEPQNNVLCLVAEHFQDRMPSEYFVIVDAGRSIAAVHSPNEEFSIRYLTGEEAAALAGMEQMSDEYTMLWRTFFDTIGIKERKNPECQRNLSPIWRRRHVTEFMT